MTYVYPTVIIAGAALLSWPLGGWLFFTLDDRFNPGGGPDRFDRVLARLAGPRVLASQDWKGYARSMLVFNAAMFAWGFAVLLLQGGLPLNPDGKGGLAPDLAFHTAVSFTTNTNLQHYSGEVALSHFSQILALTWLQFVSAATGLSCLAAIARALRGQSLEVLDVMGLASPRSAILSAVVFNAIVIPMLVPTALRGVRYRPVGANALLRRNLLVYGLGGLVAPFVGIKLIDLAISTMGLA